MTETPSQNSVLIVDDDLDICETITESLEILDWQTQSCNSVDEAISILKEKDFTLILSDYRMPEKEGIELLNWCLKNKASTPFVFMSGYSDIKNPQEAIETGARGFIAKPFTISELEQYLDEILSSINSPDDSETQDDYIPLSFNTIIEDCSIPYNIYAKVNEKYIRIAHHGEDLTQERIQKYQEKGGKTLYLQKSDYNKFVQFNTNLALGLNRSSLLSESKKLVFVENVGNTIFEHIKQDGADTASLMASNKIVQSSVTNLLEDDENFNLLNEILDEDNFLFTHSLSVSVISVMIAVKNGWQDPDTLYLCAIGGLLHDIAKKDWPKELITGTILKPSEEQNKLIENHGLLSAALIKKMPGLSEELATVVAQHHERCSGKGRPLQLKYNEIHPVARAIALADYFANKLSTAKRHKLSKFWAFNELACEANEFDPELVAVLFTLFHQRPKDFGLVLKKAS